MPLSKIKEILEASLFPKECVICSSHGNLLCNNCFNGIELNKDQYCPICQRATKKGLACNLCKKNRDVLLDQMIILASYQEENLAHIIHCIKYQFIKELLPKIGKELAKSVSKNISEKIDFILPIPLHPYRFRWRGFNQSTLLAKEIGVELTQKQTKPIIVEDLIIRKKYTRPQMKIKTYQKRLENLKNVFILNPKYKNLKNEFSRKNFLIVDDVCTTGSTIFNYSRELQKVKPKKVIAAALSRKNKHQ